MILRGLSHDGVHELARTYRAQAFVGRGRELDQLRAFLAGPTPHALLAAPAGRGKSALALRWAEQLDAAGHRVAWVPISLRFGTHRSATVEELMAARLRTVLGRLDGWKNALSQHEGEPVLVVLDGLDELQDEALLEALRDVTLASSVKLLVTVRPVLGCDADAWQERLGWSACERLSLEALAEEDVQAWVSQVAPGREGSLRELMRRTGGDPLLVSVSVERLAQGHALPDVQDPAELVGAWWAEQRAGLQAPQDAVAERALAALGAAGGLVPWSVLASVVDAPEREVREALRGFARFVVEVSGGVVFAHPRFQEVACWTYAEATQQAQQRFAELVLQARQTTTPDPYFLHFGLAHLEAAGTPFEQRLVLAGEASRQAWLRAEGSAFGYLDEVQKLLDSCLRWLGEVWGTAAMPAALRAQAYLWHVHARHKTEVSETKAEFLTELRRHDLITAEQLVQRVARMIESSRDLSFQLDLVLPVLSTPQLFDLLATIPQGDETWHPLSLLSDELLRRLPEEEADRLDDSFFAPAFMASAAVSRLVRTRRWDDLFAYLARNPEAHPLLAPLVDQLPEDQRERWRREMEANLASQGISETPLELQAALPPELQREALARHAQAAQNLAAENPQGWLDDQLRLLRAAVELGHTTLALDLLRRWLASEAVFQSPPPPFQGSLLTGAHDTLAFVLSKLQAGERAEAMAIVAELVRRHPPITDSDWREFLKLPFDLPGHEALLAGFDELFKRGSFCYYLEVLAAWPPSFRRHLSELVLEGLQRWVEQEEARHAQKAGAPPGHGPESVAPLQEVSWGMEDPAPLIPLLRRAFALYEDPRSPLLLELQEVSLDLRALRLLLLSNAHDERIQQLTRELLDHGTLQPGPWLWNLVPGAWLSILEPARRAEILRQHRHVEAKPQDRTGDLLHVLCLLDPAREQEPARQLIALGQKQDPENFASLALLAPAYRALLSAEELRKETHAWLSSLLRTTPFPFSPEFQALLCAPDPRLEVQALSSALLRGLTTDQLPLEPAEAEALARVPREEARAWVKRACARPEQEAMDLTSWLRSSARWHPEEIDALVAGRLPRPEQLFPFPNLDLAWQEPSAADRQALAWLRRLPAAFWPELARHAWLVERALRTADARELLTLAAPCLALEDKQITEAVRDRAMRLFYQRDAAAAELEVLVDGIMESVDPMEDELPVRLWRERPQSSSPRWDSASVSLASTHQILRLGLQDSLVEALLRDETLFQDIWNYRWLILQADGLWNVLSPDLKQELVSRALEHASDALEGMPDLQGQQKAWLWERLDASLQRSLWIRPSDHFESMVFPAAALRQVGGAAAVAAWAEGLVEAFTQG